MGDGNRMKRGRYEIGARCGETVLRFWDFAVICAVIVATSKQPLYPPWVGVRDPGRGGGCEKIKGIKLDSSISATFSCGNDTMVKRNWYQSKRSVIPSDIRMSRSSKS